MNNNNNYCLAAHKLQCIRDDRILFDQLSFEVRSGAILQIEGRNGSGKTSLLRILCGLSLPTEGEVWWQNQPIQDDRLAYHSILNYIGHTPGVKAELSPLENLHIARALCTQAHEVDLNQVLSNIGLGGFEDVPTRTLSAGQQRRVALARLFISDTPLWILDEPFTALDKQAIKFIENHLDTHAQRGGLAVITSHHHVACHHATQLDLNRLAYVT